MTDDRAAEDQVGMITRLQDELAELRSTVLARIPRRPTGDIEPTIRATPKADTLVLNGQLVSRTAYSGLWAWAQGAGLVTTGLFTTGDGTTTFGLPDMRGRVPVGVGTLGSDSYALGQTGGASARVLGVANLPPHDHNVSASGGSTGSGGSHGHSGSATSAGGHNGHNSGTANYWIPLNDGQGQFSVAANGQASNGSHNHSVDINDAGGHTHTVSINVNEQSVGSGTAVDIRQPLIAINWLIWT